VSRPKGSVKFHMARPYFKVKYSELNPWTETWHLGDNSPGGEFDVPRAAECLYARV